MKKFLLLILMSVSLFSCSTVENYADANDANSVEYNQSKEYLKVCQQIDSLNQYMFTSSNIQTRGKFLNWFKKIGAVVLADAAGSMFGFLASPAVAAGLGIMTSSAVAFFVRKGGEVNSDSYYSRGSTVPVDTTERNLPPINNPNRWAGCVLPSIPANGRYYSFNDSIGYFHNRVLSEICREVGSTPVTMDTLEYMVAQKTSAIYSVDSDYLSEKLQQHSDVYENACSEEMNSRNSEDIHELVEKWIFLYPERESEFRIVETFFDGLSEIDVETNDGDYLTKALEIINTSSLDEDMKQNFHNALSLETQAISYGT